MERAPWLLVSVLERNTGDLNYSITGRECHGWAVSFYEHALSVQRSREELSRHRAGQATCLLKQPTYIRGCEMQVQSGPRGR